MNLRRTSMLVAFVGVVLAIVSIEIVAGLGSVMGRLASVGCALLFVVVPQIVLAIVWGRETGQ